MVALIVIASVIVYAVIGISIAAIFRIKYELGEFDDGNPLFIFSLTFWPIALIIALLVEVYTLSTRKAEQWFIEPPEPKNVNVAERHPPYMETRDKNENLHSK